MCRRVLVVTNSPDQSRTVEKDFGQALDLCCIDVLKDNCRRVTDAARKVDVCVVATGRHHDGLELALKKAGTPVLRARGSISSLRQRLGELLGPVAA